MSVQRLKDWIKGTMLKAYRDYLKPVRMRIIPQNSRLEALAVKIYCRIFSLPVPSEAAPPELNPPAEDDAEPQPADLYTPWIQANEPGPEQLHFQRHLAAELADKPFISIVTPVFNPPLEVFKQTTGSVIAQTYPYWEWCIADGSTGNAELRDFLERLAHDEPRVRVTYLEENRGISANTNAAIAMARGRYVALLDHDDLLAPFALFEVVKAINENPNVDFLYSDEDRITEDGVTRYAPWFRPDFSAEILRSNNYLPHLVVMLKALGEQVGWLRVGFEGSQDHDLILRVTEQARCIIHIPQILYHWRAIAGSAAQSKEAKPYTHNAGRKAVIEHLERIRRPARVVDGHDANYHHAIYQLPPDTSVSIVVIVSGDQAETLSGCLHSIFANTGSLAYEIVVANCGNPLDPALYREAGGSRPVVRVIDTRPGEAYYPFLNRAAGEASNGILVFLHHDYEVTQPDWLRSLLDQVIWPENGACGGMVLDYDRNIHNAGYVIGGTRLAIPAYRGQPGFVAGYFGMLMFAHNCSAFSDHCLALRKAEFLKAGGFDPGFQQTFGDIDLCLRLQAGGLNNIWTPFTVVRCLSEEPANSLENLEDMERFRQKWESFLCSGDPNYNPNLSLEKDDFSLEESEQVPFQQDDVKV